MPINSKKHNFEIYMPLYFPKYNYNMMFICNNTLHISGRPPCHQLESVAFCCISTGVFHFPQDKAAEIAVRTVRGWLDSHPGTSVRRVIFNVFKDSDREIYRGILYPSSGR